MKNLAKSIAIAILFLSLSTMYSCRKCQSCFNQCVQVYTHDTASKLYDTVCSKDFSNWSTYVDTINVGHGFYIKEISRTEFSSCGASYHDLNTAHCQ